MDNWNRNDQNEYTGVTAQRRNRRRTEPAAEQTEPAARPAPTEPAGLSEPAEQKESAAPAVPDEPTAPHAPVSPAGTEASDTAAVHEEPEIPAEPVVQGTDSRVPPEARRMAAAPYGVPREGAKRPGTRPQTAQRRPAAPEGRRPAPQPQRDAASPETLRSGAGMRDRSPRVNVGYAPGRMSDNATRMMPATETSQDSLYNREARAYLEKRKQPFRMEEERKPLPNRSGSKTLRVLVALLVVAGAVLTGWMLLKNGNNPGAPANREPPQVLSFDPERAEGIAPMELIFSAETDKEVAEVQLHADGDRDLETIVKCGDNADSKVWTIKLSVATGFSGTVMLQVRRNGEEEWIDTGRTSEVIISSPIGADAPQEDNPGAEDPEDDDYYDPDAQKDAEANGGQPVPETTPAPSDIPGEQTTPVPEEQPTEEPEDGEPGVLYTPEPTPTPAPTEVIVTPTPPLEAAAAPEANPDLITQTTVYTSMTKKEKDYNRAAKELIHMPAADEYTKQKLGVMTFRGDNFRRNAAAGALSAAPLKLSVLWQTEAGSARGESQTYYGYQWTGQPVIARWSTEVRTKSNITEAKIDKSSLKEVIIAGVDGSIRFLDLEDGKITRNSIKLGYAMKGTPSLHPRGYPFMSVGQFARKMKNKRGQIGLRQYNLYSQKELKLIDGLDGKYHRPLNDVGSFETSALIDRESDTLIAIGTNGMLYLESLGSNFDYNLGVMTVSPSVVAMNSRAKGQKSNALVAVESSPAAYDKYVFYADMGGVLRCVDTNKLTPVWAVNTGDSVMAAIAMDLTENRELNLYTANMLNNRKRGNGNVQIRRYDALSGREAWCTDIGVFKGKKDKAKDNVGAKASPVIGQNGLSNYVYFTVTGLSEEGVDKLNLQAETPAALIALNKEDGKVAWAYGLGSRSESSPIALYDNQGNGWIIQCEQSGMIHLLDGLTGNEVANLQVEGEIEASPAAYNNVVVIGTTGKGKAFVYGIEVKLDKPAENDSSDDSLEEKEAEAVPEENAENAEDADYAEEAGEPEENGDGEFEEYDEPGEYDEYEDFDPNDEESGDGRQ